MLKTFVVEGIVSVTFLLCGQIFVLTARKNITAMRKVRKGISDTNATFSLIKIWLRLSFGGVGILCVNICHGKGYILNINIYGENIYMVCWHSGN